MTGIQTSIEELARNLSVKARDRGSPRPLPLPSRKAVIHLLDSAKEILFPGKMGSDRNTMDDNLESILTELHKSLSQQIYRALAVRCHEERESGALVTKAEDISHTFIRRLPELQAVLESDVQGAYMGDPALYSTDEAILCYPGIAAIICFRLAHELNAMDVPFLPRMMTEHAHSVTGIDIHPGAQIGESFFIDHGTGVVIGETSVIGNRVRLYQGVTLGAKSLSSESDGKVRKGLPRHPIVEDDVVIYSWASILGRITIGHGSIIGGNVWVTRDVPPGSVITQAKVQQTGFSDGAGI